MRVVFISPPLSSAIYLEIFTIVIPTSTKRSVILPKRTSSTSRSSIINSNNLFTLICISNLLYGRDFLIRITTQLSYRTNIFSSSIFSVTLPLPVISIISNILIISSCTPISCRSSWLRSMSSSMSFTLTIYWSCTAWLWRKTI